MLDHVYPNDYTGEAEHFEGRATVALEIPATVSVRWEHDETPDLSWLGEFTDDAPNRDTVLSRGDPTGLTSREFRAFRWAHSIEGTAADLRKRGYARGVAWDMANAQARQDMARLGWCGDEWEMLGVVVTMTAGGMVATASLYGIESDPGDDYRRDTVAELANECRGELSERCAAIVNATKGGDDGR